MGINGLRGGNCSPLSSSAKSNYIVKSQLVYRRTTTMHIAPHTVPLEGATFFSAKLLISRNNLTTHKEKKKFSVPVSELSQLDVSVY